MKILISLFLISILNSCQSVNYLGSDAFTTNKGNGFFVEQVNSIFDLNSTCCDSIEYKPYELLVSEARRSAQNQMISERDVQTRIASLPAGGRIIATMKRSSIDAANTKYFTFVLMEGDKELQRESGYDNIPNIPPPDSDLWSNSHVIDVSYSFQKEIRLFIIDNLMTTRNEFKISRPSEEQYLEYQRYWNW